MNTRAKNGRKQVYFEMYVAAIGIQTLMTPLEIQKYNETFCGSYPMFKKGIPNGFCWLGSIIKGKEGFDDEIIENEFPELEKLKPKNNMIRFWFTKGDWEPRIKLLEKLI